MQIPTPHRLVFDSPMLLNDESERQISNEGPLSVNIPDRPQHLVNQPQMKPSQYEFEVDVTFKSLVGSHKFHLDQDENGTENDEDPFDLTTATAAVP